MIPLISEHKLPYNIYEPITYYLGKSDHLSLVAELKRKNLAISVSNYLETNDDHTVLFLDITVENTGLFHKILKIVRKHFNFYQKNFKTLSEDAKRLAKIEWSKAEDPEPHSHITTCVEQLLRSEILFTSKIFEHECSNITFEKCVLILVDNNFEIETKRDEYELQYEDLEFEDSFSEIKNDFWQLQTEKVEFFNDKVNKSLVKILNYKNSEFVQIFDSFKTTEATILLRLRIDATVDDELSLNIFYDNIKNVYGDFFDLNGITIDCNFSSTNIEFMISGNNPLLALSLIVSQGQFDLLDPFVVAKKLLKSQLEEKHDHGYIRTCNGLSDIYLNHTQNLETQISQLEKMIDDKDIHQINLFNLYKKAYKIEMIFSGIDEPELYYSSFKKIVDQLDHNEETTKFAIQETYRTDIPVSSLCVGGFLSQRKIKAEKTIKAKNKATSLFFRIDSGIRSEAICRVLEFVLREKFFTKLRTEQKLGYIVFVSSKILRNDFFFNFTVQSDLEVLPEIFKFIHAQDFEIVNFQSIINEITMQKLNRTELIQFYGSLMSRDAKLEDWHSDLCDEIRKITSEDLKEALLNAEMVLSQSESFE
ncbi:putative with similarity to n-arginine dibasic convertase zn2+-dependentinsulinase superfamily [Pseudoloma neurophilia]|uniref:Putative with similarity to n-arginine dibasic convertase zn2+-dependentinsulinase superfamily n=1 Tax=Pseudoloma neurophilia TaxID=146866 RepID=A0A0R0M3I8_9MICR|nr:putative with similarity to n-arginine dibasic convertase zn2+-dependentinsulinase superfamily [Pseudoloma neurophilia]